MRTVSCSTRLRGRGLYLPGGGYLAGGVPAWGVCTCQGDVPARRMYLSWGMYLPREVYLPLGYLPQCMLGYTLPWREFLTHAGENKYYLAATTLQTVNIRMTSKDPFTPSKSKRESEKELAKGIKETIPNIKENFHFASAFAQCEWVLIGFMIWYCTWKKFLLTKVHSRLLVSSGGSRIFPKGVR